MEFFNFVLFMATLVALVSSMFVKSRIANDPDMEGFPFFIGLILFFIGGFVSLGAHSHGHYYRHIAIVLAVSALIAVVRALVRYRGDIKQWFGARKERFRKWRELKRSIAEVKTIFRESKVPPKTNVKLGVAIAEWEDSKRKLPLLSRSLKNLEAELLRMSKALEKAKAGSQQEKLDRDIADSYTVIAGDLAEQHEKLAGLVAEVKKDISTRKARLAMIADFFKDIPEQAKVYEDYDRFSAEAMGLQKNLKDELAKVPK